MRKTKFTAIIMLIIASMLTSVMPVWAAEIDEVTEIVSFDLRTEPGDDGYTYHPYLYGTTYGEDAWSRTSTLGSYGRRLSRSYATLNFAEIASGYNFAAYGIKCDDGEEIDISEYENPCLNVGIYSNTDDTVSADNLYYVVMTKGSDGIVFTGIDVDAVETTTIAISDLVFVASTGTDTSFDMTKVCGIGIVRMNVSEGETAPESTGRIWFENLSIIELAEIDDLTAEIMDGKPRISFTAPGISGIDYTLYISGDDDSERVEYLSESDFTLTNGKYTWIDEAAESEVTYNYVINITEPTYGLTSVSNVATVTVPMDIGGDPAPTEVKSSVLVQSTSSAAGWGQDAFGTKRSGSGTCFGAWDTCDALGGSTLRVNLGDNTYKTEDDAKADEGNPSHLLDYFFVARVADNFTGGPDGTKTRCINVAEAAETGKAVYRIYVEDGVDIENSYFAIGQRWFSNTDYRLNFGGVPVNRYITEEDKGKAITVVIPLSDFKVGVEGNFHRAWHYNFDWESATPEGEYDIDWQYYAAQGVIRDASKGSTTANDNEDIYIAEMAICDPKPVSNLEIRESSPAKIILGWDHAPTLTSEYRIYRDVDGEKEYVGATTLNRFADETGFEIGEEATYYVAGVNELGAESPMEEVSVVVESIGQPAKFKAENIYSSDDALAINITWDAPKYGDLAGYEIYRNGTFYETADAEDVGFIDLAVNYGEEYSYYMQAVDTAGRKSLKTETFTQIAAAVPTVEGFGYSATNDNVTFSWDTTEYADNYELTVNGQVYDVTGTSKTIQVPYRKQIDASVKGVNTAGAKSYISKLPVFALYDTADTYEGEIFTDDAGSGYKIEKSPMDAGVEAVNDKSIFGEKSLLCDFTKVSGGNLEATILKSGWDVTGYRRNNSALTFWINTDKGYDNLYLAIQGGNEKISGTNVPMRSKVALKDYVTQKGKWTYVEIPFTDFPQGYEANLNGNIVTGTMDYSNVKGIAIIYDGASVITGETFYFDDIKVRTNPLWAAPTYADEAGNAITNGGTISADAKAVVMTFAEAMDAASLSTDNVWIEDAAGNVLNSYVSYADNKCTISFIERLAQSTAYTLNIQNVKSAKGVTGNDIAVSFTSGTEAATGELNTLPAIEPVITGTNSGSTVKVTVSMPSAPVYAVGDYNITVSYDKAVLTPNGSTATVLDALTGATVTYGDGVITLTGNANGAVLSDALAEITFGVSRTTSTNVTVGGSMDVVNAKAGETYTQSVSKTASISVQTAGSAVGAGGGGGGGGGTAGREDATIKGDTPVNPTEGEQVPVAGSTFTDINSVPWAADAIKALIEEGIISGYPDNTVKPEKTITREEFTSLLVRTFSFKSELTESPFADVASDAWYANAIIVAQEKGIVSGINESDFGIGSTITREDMCTMIYRAMQASRTATDDKYDSYQFADDEQISDYAKEAIEALYKGGIISGVSETEFAPKAEVNRAMAARVLYGVLGMM